MAALIDTSAWLFALGPKPVAAIKRIVEGYVLRHEAAGCAPVVFELLRGVESASEASELRDYLLSLTALPVDTFAAARWAAGRSVRGARARSMDLLIAHTAFAHRAILVHADGDFDRLARRTGLATHSLLTEARSR